MRVVQLSARTTALLAGPAFAQDADCANFKWPINRELTAFKGDGLPVVASGAALPGLVEAAQLKLLPQDQVTYTMAPKRAPKHTPAYGGSFTLPPIASGDTYQVTISDDAWIEVAQNGAALKQTGFTGSHSCKAVHKSVRFSLATGPATVEISDSGLDSLKIEVLPKEQ